MHISEMLKKTAMKYRKIDKVINVSFKKMSSQQKFLGFPLSLILVKVMIFLIILYVKLYTSQNVTSLNVSVCRKSVGQISNPKQIRLVIKQQTGRAGIEWSCQEI